MSEKLLFFFFGFGDICHKRAVMHHFTGSGVDFINILFARLCMKLLCVAFSSYV